MLEKRESCVFHLILFTIIAKEISTFNANKLHDSIILMKVLFVKCV